MQNVGDPCEGQASQQVTQASQQVSFVEADD